MALAAQAQFPIGHANAGRRYAPSLFAEPLWLDNANYGYRIQGAPPGAAALIMVSAHRHDQLLSGLQVYLSLDPADILVTHFGTTDATGQARFSIPLMGPDVPALAGLTAYAQAAVADPASPGNYGTSQGVLLEVDLHPLCAVGNFATGIVLLDPFAGTQTAVTGFPAGTAAYEAVFANGGRDLFVATSNGLFVVDTLAPVPTATLLAGGPFYSIVWDRVHHRIYAVSSAGLNVVDGNRSSPAFGSTITQTPSSMNNLAISADGKVLAGNDFAYTLERRDSDPSSPSYLQILPAPPLPIVFTFGVSVGRVNLSPDGRVASIVVTQGSPLQTSCTASTASRDNGSTTTPVTPGYQPLSSSTHPWLSQAFGSLATRDGSALVVVGGTSIIRVELDLSSPSNLVRTTTTVAPPSAFLGSYDGLTPSGRFLVRHEFSLLSLPVAGTYSLVEVSTGAVTPWITVPNTPAFSQAPVAVWR